MATLMTKAVCFSTSRLTPSSRHQVVFLSRLHLFGLSTIENLSLRIRGYRHCGCGSKPLHQYIHTSTAFSATGLKDVDKLGTENLLQAWFNETSAFGAVKVHNIDFDVVIQPLNPVDYPDLNKSIVKMYYHAGSHHGLGEQLESHKLSELAKLCALTVCVEGEKLEVTSNIPPGVRLPLICVISVPLKFDVEVKDRGSKEGRLIINKMESDKINVYLEQGDCHLNSLKTASVKVQCDDGNIVSSRQLLGAIQLNCSKKGSIKAERLQGVTIQCATDEGDLDIKTVYAETSHCASQYGHVHIRNCHGSMTAICGGGNLTVDSLDGTLKAELERGSADVFITRPDDVNIQTKHGDVTLRFSEDVSCSLELDAQFVEPDDTLVTNLTSGGKGYLRSESENVVKALAPQGKICLKKQDWLSSIKLQFGNTAS